MSSSVRPWRRGMLSKSPVVGLGMQLSMITTKVAEALRE